MPRAKEIAEQLAETLPGYLAEPSYAPAVQAYCITLARIERVASWLEQQTDGDIPELDGDGVVRAAADLLLRLERQAEAQRQRLGLDPLSRARLGRDVAGTRLTIAQQLAAYQGGEGDE
jgi:hypothetical protein